MAVSKATEGGKLRSSAMTKSLKILGILNELLYKQTRPKRRY